MATYQVETDGGTYEVETDDQPEKSFTGFAKNLGQDIVDTGKGLGHLAEGLVTHPIDTVSNIPKALMEEGKRIGVGELLTGHPINAAEKFGNAFYEKPLTTGLDVAPVIGGASKLLGASKAIPLAEEAAQFGKASSLGEDVAQAAKTVPSFTEDIARTAAPTSAEEVLGGSVPKPPPEVPKSTLSKLSEKIPTDIKDKFSQVNEAIKNQYQKTAQKPGMANTVADYLKEGSQNIALKDLGASPGQVRKVGVERAHNLADYALENGYVGPKVGTIGRGKMIAQHLEEAGGEVGGFRKMATDRGAQINPDDLIKQIRSQLDNKYLKEGIYSGEKNTYLKALQELKKTNGTAEQLAAKTSEIFREAKKADRLKQPSGAMADVARMTRDINHNLMAQTLTPQEMALYEKSLEDYGALTQINEFVKRRESVEAGGRLGPGSGISRAAVQKFLDSIGYRSGAKVASKLSDFIRKNPDIIQRPRDLFRKLADESAEAIDELGDPYQ